MTDNKFIRVQGAREHNLKDISVEIPRDELVVITGLSGSGKSSLAFDTIYAEGQRRYVESLSAYARQFLELMQKPDVDSIEGLSPAISIEQKTTSKNPRSTVGTVTEIHDYMRLLWARVGVPYSPTTGKPITSQTASEMVDQIMAMGDGARLYVMAPIVRGRKGEYKKDLAELRKKGFQRVKIDGQIYDLDDTPELDKKIKHDISVVVDRLIIRDDLGNRLADSVETALDLSDGLLIVENADDNSETVFSAKFACPVSGFTIAEIEPRLFSFNNPHGACPSCDGIGSTMYFDPDLVITDENTSLLAGAIKPWSSPYYIQALESLSRHYGFKMNVAWKDLDEKYRNIVLYGSDGEEIRMKYSGDNMDYEVTRAFEGVIPNLERRYFETDSNRIRDDLGRYQTKMDCVDCHGYRLKPEALAVKINDKHIGEISELSIEDAHKWFGALNDKLGEKDQQIAYRILKEINERLTFLMNVGLDYLSLSRMSGTLSGGESQRIRLASQIGSGLTGVLYVLDEPSIGLHQRDNNRLLETLKRLKQLGNTVIVVEHDEDAIRAADHLIDLGPGAGIHGGEIIASGTPKDVMNAKGSVTADYLTGKKFVPVPSKRREPKTISTSKKKDERQYIEIKGARTNNLNNVSVKIPLGVMTCVTGVSGSGKSSLTIDTLYKESARRLMKSRQIAGDHDAITGLSYLDKVIDIDQSPIGRTPRSNPATYTGAFTPIREWFAGLPEAKARGYNPGRFSFNVKGGRCETCQGDGVIKIEMHFLPDVYVECDACKGKRYNRETLEIKYKGKSIADVLDMSVEEGAEFFKAVPSIRDKLETLKQVGLTYIKIGQRATTLSGGEAQRVKLSKELSKRSTGRTLYILDEPTTGLHFEDVRKLLEVLHSLVDKGNSIVIIEHNLEVIKTADWIIDIGPEGGTKGGNVIAEGTPEDVAKVKGSYTGEFLKPLLENKAHKQNAA
jgi:excinuclease ABC subunit A